MDKTLFTTAYQGEHLDPVSDDKNDLVIYAYQTAYTVRTDKIIYVGSVNTLPNKEIRLRALFLKITLW